MKKIFTFSVAIITAFSITGCGNNVTKNTEQTKKIFTDEIVSPIADNEFNSKYTLEEMVVLSRHNIRSPLSDKDSVLGKITPYEWFNWSSNASELSLRGGALETIMGQYFRKWLENENLIPENYQPQEGEVRFYANSKQRTIATAQYFSSGMLPVANVEVEHHAEYDKMDPVFNPQLTFVSDSYNKDAIEQIATMGGDKGLNGIGESLSGAYALAADVIDMKNSDAYKSGEVSDFKTDDLEIVLEEGKEPALKGSLKTACSVSDALVLQFYEEDDLSKAAFGKTLTAEDWKTISSIKDTYGDVLFTAPLIAQNVAHPLLEEIKSELTTDNRKFSFLCGHDSNLGSVLAALGNEEYSLPNAVESKTPIGSKLVFEKWINGSGEEFVSVKLVYQTVDQLRNISLLTLDNPPMSFDILFNGIEKNADGLYSLDDFMNLLNGAIDSYDEIISEYTASELKEAA